MIFAGLLLVAAGCSAVINTRARHDRRTDFAEFKTFAFLDQTGKPARLNDPFMNRTDSREAVQKVIEESLTQRGFERDRINDAEFLIAVHAGTGDHLRPEMKRWHYRFGMAWHHTDNVIYPEGTLIIDFFSQEGGLLIWRGSAEEIVDRKGGFSGDMPKAVRQLIDAYPPKLQPIDSPMI